MIRARGWRGRRPARGAARPLEEFQARRARVLAAIGDGVAILHGAPEMAAEVAFRQNSRLFNARAAAPSLC